MQNVKTISASLTLCFSLFSFLVCGKAWSEVYQPKPDQIVASWDVQQSMQNARVSLENVKWHLHQSQFVGASNLHLRQANLMLNSLVKSQQDNAQYWYYQARVLEHQHQFDAAIQALDKALIIDPQFASAWLMKSNVLLLQGQHAQAKTTCMSLVGLANIDLVLGCSLQAETAPENVQQAYEKLTPIVKRLPISSANPDATHLWFIQMAADMASQLGLDEQAATWLNTVDLTSAPISFISQWADNQIALGQQQNVLNQLGNIVEQAGYQDDALLMRLAMAEKDLNTSKQRWQLAAKDRVTLRLQRNDTYHAADLTRFYLYVQPNPKQALYWAEQNWLQSQSHEDKALLDAAKQMFEKEKFNV